MRNISLRKTLVPAIRVTDENQITRVAFDGSVTTDAVPTSEVVEPIVQKTADAKPASSKTPEQIEAGTTGAANIINAIAGVISAAGSAVGNAFRGKGYTETAQSFNLSLGGVLGGLGIVAFIIWLLKK